MFDTTTFKNLIEPKHRQFFYDGYYADMEQQYKKIFKVIDMGKPTETWQHMGAFGMWSSNIEGGKINVSEMSEGEEASYTYTRYDNSYLVTHEMMKWDLTGIIGDGKGQAGLNGPVKTGMPQALGRGLRALEEYTAARVLTEGFGNTGYDAVATFAATHPLADNADTKNNLASGALAPASIKTALITMRTETVNEANLTLPLKAKYLIVPPSLEFVAAEVLQSFKEAYGFSNTENVIPSLEIVVWDALESSGSTYASTNWFIKGVNNDIENLLFAYGEQPFFGSMPLPGTIDMQCYGVAGFTGAVVNWRGLVGSTGV